MITATYLTRNEKIRNCLFTDTFKACLKCCNNFIKTVQFESSVLYMTIYFSVVIIIIWKYLQKYYKIILLNNAFSANIYTKFEIVFSWLAS